MVNMSSSNNSTPRSTNMNGSTSQHHHAPSTTATIPVVRSTIDDFREIIREQSFIIPNNSSSDHNHIDVPIKKYPPLPDIAVPNIHPTANTFFRTETILITPKQNPPKKQVFNHFAPTQRGPLPALNKCYVLPTMSNVMDLDEDLPQYHTDIKHRAETYTSPGDRIISPIKRPSAPLPPTSAQIKRTGQNTFVDGGEEEEQDDEYYSGFEEDEDDSRLFDEHFHRYQQPILMNNRRINHYSHKDRHLQTIGKHPTIVINGEHDISAHPLDSIDFEP